MKSISVEWLERAAQMGVDLDRLAQNILTPSLMVKYERVKIPLLMDALERYGSQALGTNKKDEQISILASALSGALGLPPSETEDSHG